MKELVFPFYPWNTHFAAHSVLIIISYFVQLYNLIKLLRTKHLFMTELLLLKLSDLNNMGTKVWILKLCNNKLKVYKMFGTSHRNRCKCEEVSMTMGTSSASHIVTVKKIILVQIRIKFTRFILNVLSFSFTLCINIIYIYIYLKTTEKLNTSQITLVEKYNLIEIVEGQVTKRLGLALFIQ